MSSLDFPDVIRLENWPTSHEYRKDIAGQTVVLSFSRGKDAIAAWLALNDIGATVLPYYLTMCYTREKDGSITPGMKFEQESLDYFEQVFQTKIMRLPHPAFWQNLRGGHLQPPERFDVIGPANLQRVGYDTINTLVKRHHKLPEDTWVIDGVRAADSPNRRTSMVRFGPNNSKRRTFRAIYDWRIGHLRKVIGDAGIKLPIDYDLWGRTFDGLDYRFVGPLAQHLPDDFDRLRRWWPLVTAALYRKQLQNKYTPATPRKAA